MGTVDRDYDRSYLYILWNFEQSEPLIITGNFWSALRSWLVECPVLQASRLGGGVSAAHP